MSTNSKILKRTGTVGGLTFLSRIFGLIRDMAIAYAFGAHAAADAFFVAFRIPNLLRRLFAEGALTISFVPVFSEYLRRDRNEAKRVVDIAFSLLGAILIGVVIVGIVAAPLLVRLIAYGFTENPEKLDLTITLTRLMFPYIFLVSLAALGMGVLNSLKHFAVPAAAPIVLNLGIIFGALALTFFFDPPVVGLAVGVLIGGAFQLGIHLPAMKRYGMMPRLRRGWNHPAVKKIAPMMAMAAYGAAVYQVNVIVITFLASFLAEGSVSWLWYADRVMEFPLGIFGISLATVLLPTLSDQAAAGDRDGMRETLNYGLRMTFFMTIPAMGGLMILSDPIIRILFEHGTFSSVSTAATANALIYFAIGLPFIAGVRITTNAFFSLKDSKTPVRIANLSVLVNVFVAVLLMFPMAHNGLALAISCAAAFNFIFQVLAYQRKVSPIGWRRIFKVLGQICGATLGMCLVVGVAAHAPRIWEGTSLIVQIIELVLLIGLGVSIYMAVLYVLGNEEIREVKALLKRSRE